GRWCARSRLDLKRLACITRRVAAGTWIAASATLALQSTRICVLQSCILKTSPNHRKELFVSMKMLIIVSLLLCLPLIAIGQKQRKAFAYDYTIDDLPNGLRLITVPTDYPNLVALQIVVQTGSRNEPEKGK